jgi:diguanylate cyclase (GGDEF)-like protein/PAS domain S-box-containing protein
MKTPMVPLVHSLPLPRVARPVLIVWLFVAIVLCLAGLTLYGSRLVSAGRTYLAVESERAKAEKDAVYHLVRFATDGNEDDFVAFERAMAKIEKAKGLRRLPVAGFASAERVTRLSGSADALVAQMPDIAAKVRTGSVEGFDAINRVHRLNLRLAPLEDELAAEVDAILGTVHSALASGILVITALLLVAGILASRRFLAQNDRLQQTLAESENQLRHMVEAAPLPLLIVRATDKRLLYVNERALEQFGLDVDGALSRTFEDFHVDPATRARLAEAISRHGTVRDFEVQLRDAKGREFWALLSAQPLRFLGVVCLLIALADIDERKRLQDDMRRKAMHDPLTGLPNRAMFMESLERAIAKARRRSSRFSVCFIDLDRFKEVNDTMGHPAGDALLLEVSKRLIAAVRQSDLVARLAGDEFVVLVEEHGGPEEVMIVAQKVLSALARPVHIDWREAKISGSIGIANFPEDGADLATLVRHADVAMYQAKERGRNNFQFYSEEVNDVSRQRLELDKRLRGALERGELFLEYQPEIDLVSGRPVGVEALVRWRDPVAGVVMPATFLPLAEETGMIVALGEWVLDRGLADLRAWQDEGLDLILSVNLSPRQLQQSDLVNVVELVLARHGVQPTRLRLEITEATLLQEPDVVQRALVGLRALGVEIAIDAFGLGYSALGLMRGLPVNVVKIDKSLVSACPNKRECAAMVQAASALSRGLGMRLVAGGVETEEQRQSVRTLGCDGMQGYFAARPTDAAGIAAMMRAAAEQTLFA